VLDTSFQTNWCFFDRWDAFLYSRRYLGGVSLTVSMYEGDNRERIGDFISLDCVVIINLG
jgi:hypothetical protein